MGFSLWSCRCNRWWIAAALFAVCGSASQAANRARVQTSGSIEFNRDIRPVLSDRCYACHGPDAKSLKGDLRLDLREQATARSKDGSTAIVPGDPDRSELVRRIETTDPDDQMPPAESHKTLNAAERALLRQWIAEGARYEGHWSFRRIQPPHMPEVNDPAWNKHPIDRFIYAALKQRGLTPSQQADRATLIRRVSLDLLGLPPSPAEIDAFIADTAAGAYERMVDRFLADPRFGERMAMIWLDLARYGDTNGYHNDSNRPAWLWRDWVIAAYNNNMPFDEFTVWQLGGDLFPGSTVEQKIASGFNRNTRFNEEGGADPAEFLADYAADRVITLGRVWLGLSLNCAQCHSHKYDPVTQKEFYQLTAFFNSLKEVGAGGVRGFHGKPVPPVMRVLTPAMAEEQTSIAARIEALEREIDSIVLQNPYQDPGFNGQFTAAQVTFSQKAWEHAVANFEPPPAPLADAQWIFTRGSEDVIGDIDVELLQGAQTTTEGLVLDGKTAHGLTAMLKKDLRAKTLEAWVKLGKLDQSGGAVIGIQTLEGQASAQRFDSIVFAER